MVVDFTTRMDMTAVNTYFKKREEGAQRDVQERRKEYANGLYCM